MDTPYGSTASLTVGFEDHRLLVEDERARGITSGRKYGDLMAKCIQEAPKTKTGIFDRGSNSEILKN